MAASTIPPILISLQADVSQLKAGLLQAQNAIKGVDDTVKKTSATMGSFVSRLKQVGAAMGVTFAATRVVQFGKESVMAASNMAESLSKVQVVFGEGADAVIKFGQDAAKNLGISNQAALEAAGTYGNLFQAFGLGKAQAQEMSTGLVQLAGDLASFNNTSVDQAITALRSGLSGETEPLKRFGVALTEVRLKEEALRMGLITTTKGTLPVAIKSQAAYALIMRDTALAQGDYARTASGTANTMKTLQAKIEDAKVALGDALMPAFRGLLGVLNLVVPILKTVGNFFKNNQDEVKAFAIVIGLAAAGWGAYTVAINAAKIAQAALNAVMAVNPVVAIVVAVGLLVAGMVKLYKANETFRKAVLAVGKAGLAAFAAIVPIVGQVGEAIVKFVLSPLKLLLSALSHLPGVGKYAKAGLDLLNKGVDGISTFADNAAKKAKDLSAKLDKMGTSAKKAASDVKKATSSAGGAGAGAGVDPAAAQEAADKAKEILEKKQQAEIEYIQASIKAHEAYQERVADIRKNYDESVADAQKEHTKTMVEISKDYAKRTLEIEQDLQDKITELRKAASEKRANLAVEASKKEASIIQQSMDRLRSAFSSAVGMGDIFKSKGGTTRIEAIKQASGLWEVKEATTALDTADSILASLRDKLATAKTLQDNAAKLAGMGYSQTFIEEVVKNGPEAGNKIAAALLAASPEATKEMQTLYKDVEKISTTGLDALAKTMNAGGQLATQELMDAYSQVAVDLKDSLAEVDRELQLGLAEAQSAYNKAMTEAKIARDERMLEASTILREKLAEAQATMDANLAEAQKTLQKALVDAQKAYQTAIDDIARTTAEKLAALKQQLAEVAAATAALISAQAAQAAIASASVSSYGSSSSGSSISTSKSTSSSTTINISGTNLSNPTQTASSVVTAIKYGTAVTISGGYSGIPKTVTPAKSVSTFGKGLALK